MCLQGEESKEEDGEKRVTVIETSTGNKLSGEDAPKKAELEEWLKEHIGYEVVDSDEEQEEEEESGRESEVCTVHMCILHMFIIIQ